MEEMILDLIYGNINGILFYFGVIVISIIIVILMSKIEKFMPKKPMHKISSYAFLGAAFIMGIYGIAPTIGPTINLIKDYNEQVFLSKEGIVEERINRPKDSDLIEFENQLFILPYYAEQIKEGDYCEIYYLKNSKYIYKFEILDKN